MLRIPSDLESKKEKNYSKINLDEWKSLNSFIHTGLFTNKDLEDIFPKEFKQLKELEEIFIDWELV